MLKGVTKMKKRKVAFVTGAGQGLGASIATNMAKDGYDVVLHYYQSEDSARTLAKQLEKTYGIHTLVVQANLLDEQEIQNMVEAVWKKFSNIDVLINNAALELNSALEEKTMMGFQQVLGINVVGTFLLSKMIGSKMQQQKSGTIIFITSNNAIDQNDPVTLEYDASKASLHSIMKNLAIAFAPFVRVNVIAPGWISTEKVEKMNQELQGKLEEVGSENILLGRFGKPEEIANVVSFLASEKASYINGEIIRVDGGIRHV